MLWSGLISFTSIPCKAHLNIYIENALYKFITITNQQPAFVLLLHSNQAMHTMLLAKYIEKGINKKSLLSHLVLKLVHSIAENFVESPKNYSLHHIALLE